jgi:hypothetical protein
MIPKFKMHGRSFNQKKEQIVLIYQFRVTILIPKPRFRGRKYHLKNQLGIIKPNSVKTIFRMPNWGNLVIKGEKSYHIDRCLRYSNFSRGKMARGKGYNTTPVPRRRPCKPRSHDAAGVRRKGTLTAKSR